MNWNEVDLDKLVVNDLSEEEQLSLRDYLINIDKEKRKEWYRENSRYRNALKDKKYAENPEFKEDVYRRASESKTGKHQNISEETRLARNKNVSIALKNKSPEERKAINAKISKYQKERYNKFTEDDWEAYSKLHSDCLINRSNEEKEATSLKLSLVWKNKSEEEKQMIKNKISISNKKTWENKTEEEMNEYRNKQKKIHANFSKDKKQSIAQQISISLNKYFSNLTEEELNIIKTRRIVNYLNWWHSLTESERELHREIGRRNGKEGFYRYLDRIGGIESHKLKCRKAYYNMSNDKINEINKKHKYYLDNRSNLEKEHWKSIRKLNGWESFSEEKQQDILNRIHKTKKLNESYGKSELENHIFNLLKINYNVIQCVRLNNYNYDIKLLYSNKETYIDIHGSFYHHYKPYTDSKKDREEYMIMKNSSPTLNIIADTWKIRDVERYNYCKENNINYIRYYIDSNKEINYDVIIENIIKNTNKGTITLFN